MRMLSMQFLSDGWELRFPREFPDPRLLTAARAVAGLLTARPRAWAKGGPSCTPAPY